MRPCGLRQAESFSGTDDDIVYVFPDRPATNRRFHRKTSNIQRSTRCGWVWLTVIGILNSALSAYYYLRVVMFMYMREGALPEGTELS
ncbi:MAG: hypothetical protein Ct9H300mP28_36350 [Pseudomonadota bacterium]|nr:MAG: hypothetical protein Ct9H300mP28_36350 [Pseudomonadota bacterium]